MSNNEKKFTSRKPSYRRTGNVDNKTNILMDTLVKKIDALEETISNNDDKVQIKLELLSKNIDILEKNRELKELRKENNNILNASSYNINNGWGYPTQGSWPEPCSGPCCDMMKDKTGKDCIDPAISKSDIYEGPGGMMFQIETTGSTGCPRVLDTNTNKKKPEVPQFLKNFFSMLHNQKKSEILIEEDDEESDESEYMSDDDFEEIDVNITSIDDLLTLIDTYYKEPSPEEIDSDTELNSNDSLCEIEQSSEEQSSKSTVEQSMEDEEIINKKKRSFSVIDGKKYSVNFDTLYNVKPVLKKLNAMIGLESIKTKIVEMILYYIQHFENRNKDMLHTVIEGPPGVGKTEVGRILAELYANLGITKSKNFRVVKRTDLIGEHIGQTDVKTQAVIDDLDGGVLFIDEAYALGNEGKKDSFSKACIDIINHNLSENKSFVCIIAGYPGELDKCFFSQNEGLKRRFPFRYKIESYTSDELADIFRKMVNDKKFRLSDEADSQLNFFFETHVSNFPYFGGDVENFVNKCKHTHAGRVFGKHPKHRRIITFTDITEGMIRFKNNKKEDTKCWLNMYN